MDGGFSEGEERVPILRVFCVFLIVQNCPSCVCLKLLFICKSIARFPNLVPQLLSFFVNLIFLTFLGFSYQHRLK